jgi:hypothetical protein
VNAERSVSMTIQRTLFLCAVIAASAVLHGCGGDTVTKVEQSTQISKGWELKDLQKALDAGAITRDEYERVKMKILNRPN